jgi:outer membrane protein assembly factor BamB
MHLIVLLGVLTAALANGKKLRSGSDNIAIPQRVIWQRDAANLQSTGQIYQLLPPSQATAPQNAKQATFAAVPSASVSTPVVERFEGSTTEGAMYFFVWLGVNSGTSALVPTVFSINEDLSIRWEADFPQYANQSAGVAVSPLLSASNGQLFVTWRPSSCWPSPCSLGSLVAVTAALNSSTGEVLWTHEWNSPTYASVNEMMLVANDTLLAVATAAPPPVNGTVTYLNTVTGNISTEISLGLPVTAPVPLFSLTLSPDEALLIVSAGYPGSYLAINISSNEILWRHTWKDGFLLTSSTVRPSFPYETTREDPGRVLLIANSTSLVALNASTGVLLFSTRYPNVTGMEHENVNPTSYYSPTFVVTTRQGMAFVLQPFYESTYEFWRVMTYNLTAARADAGIAPPLLSLYKHPIAGVALSAAYAAEGGSTLYVSSHETSCNVGWWTPLLVQANGTLVVAPNQLQSPLLCNASPVWPGPDRNSLISVQSNNGVMTLWQ